MPAHRRPAVGTRLFARTIHGLEHVAAGELRDQGCTVHTVTPRQLVLTAPAALPTPRTVDDLFHLVLVIPDPGATKPDLVAVTRALASAPLGVAPAPVLSVSASTAGRRGYSRYDVEDAVGAVLAARLGAVYASRRDGGKPPSGAVDWRVTVDASGVHIGPRGARPPLHRRPWKTASVPGTLHPPVAAAMARLAGIRPGDVVVDPCCGAGTLLAEAPDGAFRAGSDRAGVVAARTNAPHLSWFTSDARGLPYPTGSVDHVLTNPPWDRQVTAHGTFAEFVREWRRVLRPGGRLTYLGPHDPPRGWQVVGRHPISLFGRHPVITICVR
ncbi:TRM11 family SAM-dependent methyltransferase [Actinophytocola glycyrrhizae]|uniref:TRM11 family SAM-dependent methyltransferase n=1 Tax=Actinophytocola glycyrrhizae TaxID=2044873 RepID=A0ABV9RV12_9PSEU